MSIVSDSIQNQRLILDSDGFSTDRVFIVDDVTGQPESRIYNAMIQSGIPQYGDPHPVIPNIQVTEITAEPIDSGEQFRVECRYSIPDEEDAETGEGDFASGIPVVSSGLIQEETILDINGDFIRVTYVGGSQIVTKYEEVRVQRPQMRITLTRIETEMPKATIAQYLGTINSQPWSGFPAKSWLCSNINVRKEKSGWEVEYSFAYRKELWRAVVTVRIPANVIEQYPPDVTTGNGYGVFDVYEPQDFNLLGLQF